MTWTKKLKTGDRVWALMPDLNIPDYVAAEVTFVRFDGDLFVVQHNGKEFKESSWNIHPSENELNRVFNNGQDFLFNSKSDRTKKFRPKRTKKKSKGRGN